MHTLPSCLQQQPFTSPRALFSLDGDHSDVPDQDVEMGAIDQMSAHTAESVQLLRQISIKAPQLAAVLEQLEQGGTPQRIEFADAAPVVQQVPMRRRRPQAASMLDMTAGLLSNAFPTAAPLFHSCRAYLHFKILKKKTGQHA